MITSRSINSTPGRLSAALNNLAEEQEWVVPAARMKAGREHRVPLSAAAVEVLERLPRVEGSDPVFPSGKKDAVPHGFRSSFKDWATERTQHSAEAVEMSLARNPEQSGSGLQAR